jgi:hypothetical protein
MAVHFQVQERQFLSQYEKGVVNLICANKASTLLNKEDALKLKVQLLAQPNKKRKKYVCSVIQGHQKKRRSCYSKINTPGITENAITRSLLLVTDIP